MSSYHKAHITLTRPKMLKLAKGEKVRLEHKHLSGGAVEVHLTKTQIGKGTWREKRMHVANVQITAQTQQIAWFWCFQ